MGDSETREALKAALLRIRKGRPRKVDKKRKLSISAVAEEAGVTPALIHNVYRDIAAEINRLTNRTIREQRDRKNDELKQARDRNKELARENGELKDKLRLAGIEMLVMQQEIKRLRGGQGGGNVFQFKPRKPGPDTQK